MEEGQHILLHWEKSKEFVKRQESMEFLTNQKNQTLLVAWVLVDNSAAACIKGRADFDNFEKMETDVYTKFKFKTHV